MRPAPYSVRSEKVKGLPAPNKPLALIIDAMLLAGNKTMRGILRELRRKACASCHGNDLKANGPARLYWFCRKGFKGDEGSRCSLWATGSDDPVIGI